MPSSDCRVEERRARTDPALRCDASAVDEEQHASSSHPADRRHCGVTFGHLVDTRHRLQRLHQVLRRPSRELTVGEERCRRRWRGVDARRGADHSHGFVRKGVDLDRRRRVDRGDEHGPRDLTAGQHDDQLKWRSRTGRKSKTSVRIRLHRPRHAADRHDRACNRGARLVVDYPAGER